MKTFSSLVTILITLCSLALPATGESGTTHSHSAASSETPILSTEALTANLQALGALPSGATAKMTSEDSFSIELPDVLRSGFQIGNSSITTAGVGSGFVRMDGVTSLPRQFVVRSDGSANGEIVVSKILELSRQITPLTGVSFTRGNSFLGGEAFFGELRVWVTDNTPCGTSFRIAGCAGPGWSGGKIVTGGMWIPSATMTADYFTTVILHELGHVMGLSHFTEQFENQLQVMFPMVLDDRPSSYRTGDKAGIKISTPADFADLPTGRIESVTLGATSTTIKGWAYDPNSTSPLKVTAGWQDGWWLNPSFTIEANEPRPDLASMFPSATNAYGFSYSFPNNTNASPEFCVIAPNLGAGSSATGLGCIRAGGLSPAPGTPQNPAVVPGDLSFTVNWSAPSSGVTPTSYFVVANPTVTPISGEIPKPATCGVAVNAPLTCSFTGLPNLWTYSIEIYAKAGSITGKPALVQAVAMTTSKAFTPVAPTRIVDTRYGTALNPQLTSKIQANGTISPVVTSGKNNTKSVVPVTATAVALNVTVTEPDRPGYVTVYPSQRNTPLASNLNVEQGQTRANFVTVGVLGNLSGLAKTVTLFSSTGVHVVVDLVGYWSPTSTQMYTPVTPKRITDTRTGQGNEGYKTPIEANQTRTVAVRGAIGRAPGDSGSITIPANATGVAANITAVDGVTAGYATVFPGGTPATSSVNWTGPNAVAGLAFSPIAADGTISVTSNTRTNFVIDIVGYFSASSAGRFVAAWTPSRILDSRSEIGAITGFGRWTGSMCRKIPARGILSLSNGTLFVPPNATALDLNVTVTNTRDFGWLSIAPSGSPAGTSTINWTEGTTVANHAVTKIGADGKIEICTEGTSTDVVIDVSGWLE